MAKLLHTPIYLLESLSKYTGVETWVKDETKNLSGSFKDRATINVLSRYKNKDLVLSSSGNAAISYMTYFKNSNQKSLHIFISESIDKRKKEKIDSLLSLNIYIHSVADPRKEMVEWMKSHKKSVIVNSTVEHASSMEGYTKLGMEIEKDLPEFDSIFVNVSSGTAFCGIYKGFVSEHKFFAIQNSRHNSVAKLYDFNFQSEASSIADCISMPVTPYLEEITKIIDKSHGSSYAIENLRIESSIELLKRLENLNLTNDGALTFAGYIKAIENGDIKRQSRSVIIISG